MTATKKHGPNTAPKDIKSPNEAATTFAAYSTGPTNYAEIQQNELAVLQSIYMDDFEGVKVKAAAWSVSYRVLKTN